MSDEIIIEAVGLSKIFKDFWGRPKAKAVNGIDFQVKKGEVFGLLGPNGSGKSTTIKMLLGLLYPTRGALQIFDKSPRDVKTKQRIGYLPEDTYLYKYLTAGETVDFFGSLFQLPADERKKRTQQLLEMVGLKMPANAPSENSPKGMARRIGLAQALVNDPDLIILDEPTSGLDPVGCRDVKNLILELKNRGKTVILSSHLLADVEDVVDRVIVLYGGKVQAEGTIDKLLTVDEKTKIVTPHLKKETLDRVLKILNEECAGDIDCLPPAHGPRIILPRHRQNGPVPPMSKPPVSDMPMALPSTSAPVRAKLSPNQIRQWLHLNRKVKLPANCRKNLKQLRRPSLKPWKSPLLKQIKRWIVLLTLSHRLTEPLSKNSLRKRKPLSQNRRSSKRNRRSIQPLSKNSPEKKRPLSQNRKSPKRNRSIRPLSKNSPKRKRFLSPNRKPSKRNRSIPPL